MNNTYSFNISDIAQYIKIQVFSQKSFYYMYFLEHKWIINADIQCCSVLST